MVDLQLTDRARPPGESERRTPRREQRDAEAGCPKDDTPGCTKQACGIRDAWDAFRESGAAVFGVSPDSEKPHAKFKQK